MVGGRVKSTQTMLPVGRHVRTRARILLASGFAFTTGWADAICLMRWKAFATMMTGNMILIGYRIAETRGIWVTGEEGWLPDWVYHLSIVLAYFVGIVLFRLTQRFLPFWTGVAFAPVVALCITVLEICRLNSDNPGVPHRWDAVLLAPVFAVQSAVSTRGGLGVPTTMLTGHLQNLGFSLVHCVLGRRTSKERKANFLSLWVIIWLCIGAFCGALAVTRHSLPPVCSAHPTCVALGLHGSCCPTERGMRLDCCSGSNDVSKALLPVAPLLALMLVAHDIVFRPLKDPSSDEREAAASAETQTGDAAADSSTDRENSADGDSEDTASEGGDVEEAGDAFANQQPTATASVP